MSATPSIEINDESPEGQHANEADDAAAVLYHEEYKPWFLPLLIPAFYVMPFFWTYHVTITDDELSFGYSSGLTTKIIQKRGKSIVQVTPLLDQKWYGWGIHYSPDPKHGILGRWNREYICKNGGAVKLILRDDDDSEAENDDKDDHGTSGDTTTTTKTTTFYFSTDDPQNVCDILNQRT